MKHIRLFVAALALSGAPAPAPASPPSLAGLWSMNVSADLGHYSSEDLLSFYAQGALSAPAPQSYPGFSLGLRRHLSEHFFAGLQLASLPKGYSVSLGGSTDQWALDGLLLGASGAWMLQPTEALALYAEAQVGWLTLINGGLERSGASTATGSLEGSALAEQFGLGALWFILPSVALEAQGGWRFARLPLTLSTGSGRQSPPSAPEFYADFSGPYGRLGLAFFWGLKNPWGEQDAPPAPAPPPSE